MHATLLRLWPCARLGWISTFACRSLEQLIRLRAEGAGPPTPGAADLRSLIGSLLALKSRPRPQAANSGGDREVMLSERSSAQFYWP